MGSKGPSRPKNTDMRSISKKTVHRHCLTFFRDRDRGRDRDRDRGRGRLKIVLVMRVQVEEYLFHFMQNAGKFRTE